MYFRLRLFESGQHIYSEDGYTTHPGADELGNIFEFKFIIINLQYKAFVLVKTQRRSSGRGGRRHSETASEIPRNVRSTAK